jgi:ABC-type antimicrobial peptide transport system permease subunit
LLLSSLLVIFSIQASISDSLIGVLKKFGEQIYVYNSMKTIFDPDEYSFMGEYDHVTEVKKPALLYRIDNYNPSYIENSDLRDINDKFQLVSLYDTNEIILTEGRIYENDTECCITSRYYKMLKSIEAIEGLGDTISVEDRRTKIVREFTVTGIADYSETRYGDYADRVLYVTPGVIKSYYEYFNYDSALFRTTLNGSIYVNDRISHIENTIEISRISVGCDVLVMLDSYENAEDFFEFIRLENHNRNYNESFWIAQYHNPGITVVSEPLIYVNLLLPAISCLVTIIFAVVIGIMTIVFIIMRKYEIGVLRSIGMSRTMVAGMFSVECTAFVTGAALLSSVIAIPAAFMIMPEFGIPIPGAVTGGVAVMASSLLKLVITAAAMSLVSNVITVLYILRQRPMNILNNRS